MEWIAAWSKNQFEERQACLNSLLAFPLNCSVTGGRAQLTIAENWDSCQFIVKFYRQSQHLALVKGVAKREMPQM
jgi:hypothetical protein